MSARIPLPRSAAASLVVVYYAGEVVVTKGRRRQRKASFPTITMHVDDIYTIVWTSRNEALRSIFPIRMYFEGHLMCIAAIMWSILRRQNL